MSQSHGILSRNFKNSMYGASLTETNPWIAALLLCLQIVGEFLGIADQVLGNRQALVPELAIVQVHT